MPRTNSPAYSTYETKQYTFVKEPFVRSGYSTTYDARYQNCVFDAISNKITEQKEVAVSKRPGIDEQFTTTGTIRGMYHWEVASRLVYVVGNTFYFRNLADGSTTNSGAVLTTTTGDVGFEEFLYSDGHVTLVWADGTKLGEISTALVVTTSADADIPSNHVPKPIYLDGYIFLINKTDNQIYNSDVDAPLVWTSGNYIGAEASPDKLLWIERMSNYIVAFGSASIEFFYDAAATSSPLARNDIFYKQIGYIGGAVKYLNKVFFIGRAYSGTMDIFVAEDSKVSPLGNEQIKKYLADSISGFDSANVYGVLVPVDGRNMYIFTVNNETWMYDIDLDMFSVWTKTLNKSTIATTVAGHISFVTTPTQNAVLSFSTGVHEDYDGTFTTLIRTDNDMYETMQLKFMGRFSLFSDQNTLGTVNVSWTDDDYQHFSTARSIKLNQDLPSLRKLGGFRKRAFLLTSTDQYPFRLQGFEVDLNKGSS